MGLDTTHDCWHGSYSSFHRWRCALAQLCGFNLNEMVGFDGTRPWSSLLPDQLHVLLNHSDCDGKIYAVDCAPLADRLEALLPLFPDEDGGGHIGNWRKTTQRFIDGLRCAAECGEDVEFR